MPLACRRNVVSRRGRIKNLLQLSRDAQGAGELETSANLAAYACVRIVGSLEKTLEEIALEVLELIPASTMASNFALSYSDNTPNPTHEKLLTFLGRFDSAIRDQVAAHLGTDGRQGQLNGLVGIRNMIAHGENQGISIANLERDYLPVFDGLTEFILSSVEAKYVIDEREF